jgi:hypothetical protein
MPGGDPVVATYPYEIYNTAGQVEPMSWQSSDGYSFRIFGGYAYIPGVHGRPTLLAKPMDPSGLQEFLAAQAGVFVYGPRLSVSLDLVATTRATIAAYDIRAVIVDRSRSGSGQVVQLFDDTLGPPVGNAGHVGRMDGLSRHLSTAALAPAPRPAKVRGGAAGDAGVARLLRSDR